MIAAVAIGLLSVLLFLPFHPVMPRLGFDPSWVLGINEAVAQQFAFGSDVLYTAGPFASIWTQAYHPSLIYLTVFGGLFLAVGHAFTSHTIYKNSHKAWLWAYAAFLLFLLESRDALFLSYPVLLGLLIYRMALPSNHAEKIQLSKTDLLGLMVAIAALGLLPIIKLSFMPLTLLVCMLGALMLWRSGAKQTAATLLMLPMISMLVFWLMLGQTMGSLADYLLNNRDIVSGFTQAMSVEVVSAAASLPLSFYPIAFIVISLGLVFYFYKANAKSGKFGILEVVFIVFIAAFLFLTFKAGFVRHDVHALTASSSLLIAIVLLGGFKALQPKLLAPVFALAMIVWLGIHNQNSDEPFEYYKPLSKQIIAALNDASSGNRYQAGLASIRQQDPIPVLEGTTDIYPHDVASLIASGNHWTPRPVFQSFSAYTPGLARLNANWLASPKAPDNIVFSVFILDNRYPSLDDGASWPQLMANYKPIGTTIKYILLRKNEPIAPKNPMTLVFSGQANLGEAVQTNHEDGMLFAEIDITPTSFGKLMGLIYKPSTLNLFVQLSNGQVLVHRLNAGQASAGFVLSPYIADTRAFFMAINGPQTLASLPRVMRFKIEDARPNSGMWNNSYTVKLHKLPVDSQINPG